MARVQGSQLVINFHQDGEGRAAIAIPSPAQLEAGRRIDLTGCLLSLQDVTEQLGEALVKGAGDGE